MRLGLVLLGETAHVSRLKRAWSRPLRAWCEHHAGMMMSPALSCAPLFFSPSVDSALCSRSRRLLVMRSVMGGMSQLHVPARRDGGWVVGGVEHVKGETRGLRSSLCSLEGRVEEERGKEGKPCRAPSSLESRRRFELAHRWGRSCLCCPATLFGSTPKGYFPWVLFRATA